MELRELWELFSYEVWLGVSSGEVPRENLCLGPILSPTFIILSLFFFKGKF